jgi:dihydroneopterin aldolase
MSDTRDRIVLHDMLFLGRHGVDELERREAQPFAVDVEILRDLGPAGRSDDLDLTVDYAAVFATCREVVEGRSLRLIEALAEAIADEILGAYPVGEVVVRVRKLRPPIEGTIGWAGVEVVRSAVRGSRGASRG